MLDFCGQDYNLTSHETDFTRSADTIGFYLIKFQFNAVNIQVSADTPSSAEIEMAVQAIK